MATTTLTLYKHTKLDDMKNFVVDDIESYLSTKTKETITGFQYQRFEINKTIKLDKSQSYLLKGSSLNKYDYLSISTGEVIYYYFILRASWKAEETIELDIKMDTLNTFGFSNVASDSTYTLSNKTLVTREHKDRMKEFTLPNRFKITLGGTIQDMTLDYQGYVYIDPQQVSESDPEFGVTPQFGGKLIKIFEKSTGLLVMTLETENEPFLCGRSDNNTLYIHEDNTSNYWYFNDSQYYIVPDIDSQDYAAMIIFYNTKYRYFTTNPIKVYRRIIDKFQEGLSTTLFKDSEETLYDENGENQFHLVFTSANNVTSGASDTEPIYDNPVKLLVYADVPYVIASNTKKVVTFTSEELPNYSNEEEFFIFNKSDFVDGTSYVEIGGVKKYLSDFPSGCDGLIIARQYNVFNGVGWRTYTDWGQRYIIWGSPSGNFSEFKCYNMNNINVWSGTSIINARKQKTIPTNSSDSSSSLTSYAWNQVDLTNPKFIKAFEFPYNPVEFLVKSKIYSYPSNWSINSGLYALQCDKIQEESLSRLLIFDKYSPFNELSIGRKESTPIGEEVPRDIRFESKLFHSDYFQPKFVYDSAHLSFMLENCDVESILAEGDDAKFKANYVVSKNVVSKFSFQFLQYICEKELQDYNNVCCVERNNEQALYTNAYINYIKSGGYSYDQKKANSNNAVNGISTVLSLMGGAASLVAGWGTGNAMLMTGGIALLSSGAAMVTRNIHTAQEQDRGIAQKIAEGMNQSINVQGCEDIDILKSFSGNKAKICYYELSNVMKMAMWDLFHYCGYATHEQKVPNVKTRLYFNFVQADIVYDEFTFNEDIADDIKNKWKQGVTFFHKVSGDYDIDQEYENFEVSLI